MKYIIIGALSFLLFSCGNAVKKVLSDPAKKEQVGREWEKEHPCVNDTIHQLINGKDSVVYDTTEKVIYHTDTLTNIQTKELIKLITKTQIRIDTLRQILVDNRRLNIALDSLVYYHGFKDEIKNELATEKKITNKWRLYFWILIGLLLLLTILKLKK